MMVLGSSSMEVEVEGWLRLVKIFVVVAGFALVAGTALLVALLLQRSGGSPVDLTRPKPLALPAGMRLVDVSGGGDTLILQLEDAMGAPHLLVVERDRGRVLAFWRIEATP
jgi:hypothetical protein